MKKILLIEDNDELRENTSEILELAGYDIIVAENGKVGINKAIEHLPDLIICDIMMPEIDGYEVLHLLSKKPKCASIPFIFLTAKSEKSDFRKGMGLGADDYITKPFKKLALLETIEKRFTRIENLRNLPNQKSDSGLHQFFDPGESDELKKLLENQDTFYYQAKQLIYSEGASPRKVYYIKKGTIKVYRINNFGKELILDVLKEGDFLGYHAIIEDRNYVSSAMVIEDCEIIPLANNDFLNLLYNDRNIASKFIKLISNRLNTKQEQLLDIAYQTVRIRIGKAINQLMEPENDESGFLKYSRDDLAKYVGTSTETTIRTLSEFKKEGIITINKQGIEVNIKLLQDLIDD